MVPRARLGETGIRRAAGEGARGLGRRDHRDRRDPQRAAKPPGLQEPAKKALATLDRQWDGLIAHRDYPVAGLDNNLAERTIRGPIVTRKNAWRFPEPGHRRDRRRYLDHHRDCPAGRAEPCYLPDRLPRRMRSPRRKAPVRRGTRPVPALERQPRAPPHLGPATAERQNPGPVTPPPARPPAIATPGSACPFTGLPSTYRSASTRGMTDRLLDADVRAGRIPVLDTLRQNSLAGLSALLQMRGKAHPPTCRATGSLCAS